MKQRTWLMQTVLLLVFTVFMGVFAVPAGAEEMLQNPSFESYDAGTLVPDHWQVLAGSVEIHANQAYDGAVSVYSLGGTMIDGVDTPNPPQGGTLVQVVDLSTMAGWAAANWIIMDLWMHYRIWGTDRTYGYIDYLPAAYNDVIVAADDPAWEGPDVRLAYYTAWGAASHASPSDPWRVQGKRDVQIPKVRWMRVRLEINVQYLEHTYNNYFDGGGYYTALDAMSVDARAVVPDAACSDNILANPDFESVTSGVPDNWQVLDGRMTALDQAGSGSAAYAGDGYVGNLAGFATPELDPNGNPVHYPDPPVNGRLVQLVDLSSLPDWSEAGGVAFRLSGYYLNKAVIAMSARVEYLPESFNETPVSVDDAAWESDAEIAVLMSLDTAYKKWTRFETGQGSLPPVRWVRVLLSVDDGGFASFSQNIRVLGGTGGEYLGGFDRICLEVNSLVAGDLVRNASFEEADANLQLAEWHRDPADGAYQPMTDPPVPDGLHWLAKFGTGADTVIRFYQVIDLAGKIPFWQAIDPYSGYATEFRFIQLGLGAWITNHGGSRVAVNVEYLPYSYNAIEGITWDHAAWQPRQWVSDGTAFTNNGGDAIDLGALIEDTTVDPAWRQVTCESWIPRARWLRLHIELDATPNGGSQPVVGIDDVTISAVCRQYGPYSGFGQLPEAYYPGAPEAPDLGIPGWTGPEGDGIAGGYTGQTERNYPNPAFAGYADDYVNYDNSGQSIYNDYDKCPECITGRPYNDAGWIRQIVTLGDMDLAMLADHFGPAPSGTYHPGEITAVFNESPIVNGEGPDFATFENGFVLGWTTAEVFGELAFVEVSSNGADFIRFPTHSLTPKWPGAYGCFIASGVFGMTGKHINAYGDQWGTPFDLEWIADHPLVLDGTVDLNDIRYVRQVDIPGGGPTDANGQNTGMFLDSHGNVIFDSWVTWGSGGADLDAVGVLNSSAADSDGDYISDYWDNCSQTANDNQYDTDADGYGNMCDCDLNNDGRVNMDDFNLFREAWLSNGPERIPGAPGEPDTYTNASPNWNADADFNGDNYVNINDFNLLRNRWMQVAPFE